MSPTDSLAALRTIQDALCDLLAPLAERDLRSQFHPDLSPLGWHLGHCVFTEALWLSRARAVPAPAAALRSLYTPALSPKPARGGRLPTKPTLLTWARRQQARHREALAALPTAALTRYRLADLPLFLAQHHAQHLETMRMALAQRTARQAMPPAGATLEALPPRQDAVLLPAGQYRLGSTAAAAYDNEQPPRAVRLQAARLARRAVSNAEFLGFMEDGGYRRRELWSEAGWRWRSRLHALRPEYWRQAPNGGWLLLRPDGCQPLPGDEPLLGISRYEAEAFANWAGARLVHEYEWEAAAGLGLLEDAGMVWEWCGNRFHPYPGFRAFPYAGYSLPWFDGRHYVLRGGSSQTVPWLKRTSFRNFYPAHQRHLFAGLRLALP
ncbi:MAG: ergothioneine biosynthesis protein EgtB [Xanthomonadaceae bacterium]|nr:ergothioneine biosynthesis protein EgtB [Xanthomonadaceae bacterium]